MQTNHRSSRQRSKYAQLSAVLALLAVFSPIAAKGDIDFDTGGKHYRLVTTRASWVSAKTNAFASIYNGDRGHLATIESAEENAGIFNRLNPASNADVQTAMPWGTYYHADSGARGVWLGAADIGSSVTGASEGNFYWLGPATNAATLQFWQGGQSGSAVNGLYANWGSGALVTEPDDWNANQDHVAMQIDGWPYGAPADQQCQAGKWNDLNGSVGQAYLIEYETAPEMPEIDIQGNSVSIANGDNTPSLSDHTDFGPALVNGGAVVRSFTITNSGAGMLSLTNSPEIAVSGTHATDFTVTLAPAATVAANETTTFQITFNPSANGTRTASLSIANNDADESPYIFSIQGSGTTPPVMQAPEVATNDAVIIRWTSYPDHHYTLRHSTNLAGSFTDLHGPILGTPPINSYTDTVNSGEWKFWRVSTEQ